MEFRRVLFRSCGIQGGVRPLMGLYAGADDRKGMSKLMIRGTMLVFLYAGIASLVIIFFPGLFYHLHGVYQIPEGGMLAVQLYALSFVILGLNYLLRLYFTNRGDIAFATTLTVAGKATLPLLALGIALLPVPPAFIFLAYLFTEILTCAPAAVRYARRSAIDRKEDQEDIVLYMTIGQEDAADASQYVKAFAEEHGIERWTAFRTSVCLEEMTAYIQRADTLDHLSFGTEQFLEHMRKTDWMSKLPPDVKDFFDSAARSQAPASLYAGLDEFKEFIRKSEAYASLSPKARKVIDDAMGNAEESSPYSAKPVTVDITVRFRDGDHAILVTLDDGAFIALDPDEEKQQLITDNYELIKKLADSVEYQYILNMNYAKIAVDRSAD